MSKIGEKVSGYLYLGLYEDDESGKSEKGCSLVHGPADGIPPFCKSEVMHPGPPPKKLEG